MLQKILNKKIKKILVTGASGFIGQHLVDKLLDDGRGEIYIFRHNSAVPWKWLENKRVKILNMDITNPQDFSKIKKNLKFDIVFHLAAYIPNNEKWPEVEKCFAVNCLGAYNLIIFLKNRPPDKLIVSSSMSVYQVIASNKLLKISEQTPTIPSSFYGFSKLAADLLFERFAEDFNINTVFLRYSSVYGPKQVPNAVLPIFINNAKQGKNLTIFGKGRKVQDFVYIDDVVKANIWALKSSVKGVYNIGSGAGTNVVDLAKKIIKVFDSKSKIIFNKLKIEDKSKIVMDISRARERGFKINYLLLRGLERLKKK